MISDGTTGFGYAANNDFAEWKFAWAVHAGVAYNVNNNFKMELAYRYLNFGNVNTSVIDCANGGCSTGGGPRAYYTFREMDSHDIKFGMRWMLQPESAAAGLPAAADAQRLSLSRRTDERRRGHPPRRFRFWTRSRAAPRLTVH